MKDLSLKLKTEKAIELTILDAIQKGHTVVSELIAYMETETFKNAVQGYIQLFNEN